MSTTTKEQELKDEIYEDLLRLVNLTDNPAQMLITLANVQQDFINYFDSGDQDYLTDGNLLLSEFQKILIKIAVKNKT